MGQELLQPTISTRQGRLRGPQPGGPAPPRPLRAPQAQDVRAALGCPFLLSLLPTPPFPPPSPPGSQGEAPVVVAAEALALPQQGPVQPQHLGPAGRCHVADTSRLLPPGPLIPARSARGRAGSRSRLPPPAAAGQGKGQGGGGTRGGAVSGGVGLASATAAGPWPAGARGLGSPGRAAFGGGWMGVAGGLRGRPRGVCGSVLWPSGRRERWREGKVQRGGGIAVGPGNKQQLAWRLCVGISL